MEKFKISIFEEEYNSVFPSYRTLSEEECKNLILEIVKKYCIKKENMVEELFSKQDYYADENASEEFNFINTLNKLGIEPKENVFIDWHDFKRIDLMAIEDFSKFFYDIWYPVADDINIFDKKLNWIIFIRHDGAIYHLKINDNERG